MPTGMRAAVIRGTSVLCSSWSFSHTTSSTFLESTFLFLPIAQQGHVCSLCWHLSHHLLLFTYLNCYQRFQPQSNAESQESKCQTVISPPIRTKQEDLKFTTSRSLKSAWATLGDRLTSKQTQNNRLASPSNGFTLTAMWYPTLTLTIDHTVRVTFPLSRLHFPFYEIYHGL